MKGERLFPRTILFALATLLFFFPFSRGFSAFAGSDDEDRSEGEFIPTGVRITPTAAKGSTFRPLNPDLPGHPDFVVGQAVTTATSPDGSTLLILTSGYNSQNDALGNVDPAQSNEYIFVYDISGLSPLKLQVLEIPNAFDGLAWNPNGKEFYVSGGTSDNVHIFAKGAQGWAEPGSPILLNHHSALALGSITAGAAGLAVKGNGTQLVVANYENDSISVIDLASRTKVGELDLRPGNGIPGGEYPFWVVIRGNDKAYVSSERDRQIVVVDISNGAAPVVTGRIPVKGVPNKMILNHDQSRLFVALGNSDSVGLIDTNSDKVIIQFQTVAPKSRVPNEGRFNGANPNSLALSPDERTLYVTNGGVNSLAVVQLDSDRGADNLDGAVIGLLPTGWYPNSVSVNHDGSILYVVNGKSNTGPVPEACRNTLSIAPGAEDACNAANQYVWQLTKAGLQTIPVPHEDELKNLTEQVIQNNHYEALKVPQPDELMAFLHQHIKHVIYIVKENRTYDQILGDLDRGNGDPSLAIFPEPLTPNLHKLARQFVDLDNFFDSGEVSGDGWNWSTAARASDTIEKTEPINYAGRGLNYDYEGTNRNINMGLGTVADRQAANPLSPSDPNLLPGTADVSAPDSPEGEVGAGYLWDSALRAGLQVRNYGFFIDLTRYFLPASNPAAISPNIVDPFAASSKVAFPTKPALQDITDQYFRGYDNKFPDFYRVNEWEREFREFEANGNLPNLETVRLMHDHFGSFGSAIAGVNTVETQVADNDYAVGRIVDIVSHSQRYRDNTLIFVIEDDSQDGPDHVDAHRSIAFIVGPFVKRGVVVSNRYTTVSLVRTIGAILGFDPLGINDAAAESMDAAFRKFATPWTFNAMVPQVLRTSTSLPLPLPDNAKNQQKSTGTEWATYAKPRHDATYWNEKTRGLDFTAEDKLDAPRFNRILWEGMKGEGVPYPTIRNGQDLRHDRWRLFKGFVRVSKADAGRAGSLDTHE